MSSELLPEKENLRRAIRWLTEQDPLTLQRIEEASIRFDLSPADAGFLHRHFRHHQDPESQEGSRP